MLTPADLDVMRAQDRRQRARRDDAALRERGIATKPVPRRRRPVLAERKYNPAEPRRPDGKWGTGAVASLINDLKKTGSLGGAYFEDDDYLDWSGWHRPAPDGTFNLEIGGADGTVQVDATMDDLHGWQEGLTRSLAENNDDGTGFGDLNDEANQAGMTWAPQDEHGERWDVTATDAGGDEVTFDWPRSRVEQLHTALTMTLLADAMGQSQRSAGRPGEIRKFDPNEPRDPHTGRWLGAEVAHEALMAGIASGVAHEDQLGGGRQGVTKLAVFRDGTRGIHKTVSDLTSYTMRPVKDDVDAEELAAGVARRLGIVAPVVHRDGEHSYWQSVVPGAVAASLGRSRTQALADTDEGRLVGLLDIILNNRDRSGGNWIVKEPDNLRAPGIGVIDHGMAFETRSAHEIYGALDAISTDDFVRHYAVRNPDPKYGPDSPYIFGGNDLSPQDIRTAETALAEMRPEFERLGHLDWWEQAQARLAAVGEHAKGTKVRIRA